MESYPNLEEVWFWRHLNVAKPSKSGSIQSQMEPILSRVGPNPWISQFLWVVWAKWVPQTWEKTDRYAWMRIGIIWWLWFFKKPCMFANHIKKPWMDRIQRINYWFQSRFKYENEGSIQTQSSDGWLVQELEDLLNMEENFKKLDSLVVTYT